MRAALALAARARGRTAPNPLVGAIIVRGGQRIAGGYHPHAGAAHAEVRAIRAAGTRARGATLYLTLEPCAHHGRTPPCVEAVLDAGFRRVVVGTQDPDGRTAGRSIARLRRRGIEVTVGVESEACRTLNRGFFSRVERHRPYTVLKLASTLDGRIATRTGESRWISGPEARSYVHRLRRSVDAVAVGSGTVSADDPELTARAGRRVLHRPTRVVVDSALRTPPDARLFREPGPGGVLILGGRDASASRRRRLETAGARVVPVSMRGGHLDLRTAWRTLARLGVNEVLVEGGGGLAAALLRGALVDQLHLLLAPRLIGGDGKPALGSLGVDRIRSALDLPELRLRRIGRDLLLLAEW
jgi:diaminohydroxyphosphoribosylaminopyrimidine deaminase/5-amino-6-(5-phosphoribosylamino)uracil reductase